MRNTRHSNRNSNNRANGILDGCTSPSKHSTTKHQAANTEVPNVGHGLMLMSHMLTVNPDKAGSNDTMTLYGADN